LLDKETREKIRPIFDLELNVDGNECQFDLLCFHQQELHYLEIKYFEGEYSYYDDRWYLARQKREVNNPVHQLHRSHRLLQSFLQQHQLKIPVKSLLIFAHPHFHMYQAQENMPIIFPGQLQHFIQKLSNGNSNWNKFYEKVRNQLISSHSPIIRNKNDPVYEWGQLRKGLFCLDDNCHQQLQRSGRHYLLCSSCGKKYSLEDCLLRAVEDYSVLYPNERISVTTIFEWINEALSKDFIYNLLKSRLNLIINGTKSYYTF